jgi:hypothetical protein
MDAVTVKEIGGQTVDKYMPDITGLVRDWVERDLSDWLFAPLAEQDQTDGVGMPGKDGKVDAIGAQGSSKGPAGAARNLASSLRWRPARPRQALNRLVFRHRGYGNLAEHGRPR